jgi:hypothetical protein
MDRDQPEETHRVLGRKFCLSGGVPNTLLAFGTPDEVKAHCRKLIETVGADGGYVMDASAIMQNDATLENLRAMNDATVEYGVYRSPSAASGSKAAAENAPPANGLPAWVTAPKVPPGICYPWEGKRRELAPVIGDPEIPKRIWEENEGLAYLYIWHVLLSF